MNPLFRKALEAMSEAYWEGEGERHYYFRRRAPLWARAVWFCRRFVPRAWID